MSHAIEHCKSSARKFGGNPEDYLPIHRWLDSGKLHMMSWQHRAILHSTFGISIAEQVFGDILVTSDGKEVPVRAICQLHIQEDLGFTPNIKEWLSDLKPKEWMIRKPVDKDEQT